MLQITGMGSFCILSYMPHGDTGFPYEYVQCGRVYGVGNNNELSANEYGSAWKCFCIPR